MSNSQAEKDRADAAVFLSALSSRMNELMTLLSTGGDRERVTEDYKALKIDLKEGYARLSAKESEGTISDTEKAFLLPALHGASTRLTPATNSNPRDSNWLDAISSAQIDVDHMLDQLKK